MAKHDERIEMRLRHNFCNLYQKKQSSKRANVSSDFYILLHDVDSYILLTNNVHVHAMYQAEAHSRKKKFPTEIFSNPFFLIYFSAIRKFHQKFIIVARHRTLSSLILAVSPQRFLCVP